MKQFSNSRFKHHTVISVLLVWLFALASSWANACQLQDRGPPLESGSEAASQAARAPIVSTGHIGVVAAHIAPFDSGEDAKLRVCADEVQTIVKLPSSINLIDVAMAPPIALAWAAHLPAATADRTALALPAPGPVLPLRTRFSRLAL
jgi:hypothetical protein